MDNKASERFKGRLLARQSELRKSISQVQLEGRAIGATDDTQDAIDRATRGQEKELLFGQAARERLLMAAVEEALARIAVGTFGHCVNCEQEIGVKRLEAIPWVRLCIACQELIDKREVNAED